MTASPEPSRTARVTLLAAALLASLCSVLVVAGPASAAEARAQAVQPQAIQPRAAASDVVFIGDSVTAGFGYCGTSEPNVTCGVNSEFENNWKLGNSSLDDCDPPTGTPNDNCTNNNVNGAPWTAGPWQNVPGAPTVAYSYQIAAAQNPSAAALIENWAMTGSTPAQWDPTTNSAFGAQLANIQNQTVVMTLGANPILANFLDIKLAGVYPASSGACTSGTGEYFSFPSWYAYPTSAAVNCAQNQWNAAGSTQALTDIYNTLLNNNNQVMVLGYYPSCPWSFSNWQPQGNLTGGPAAGNSCTSQSATLKGTSTTVSQWDQANAVLTSINSMIASAVAGVQQSNANGANLQFVLPNAAAFAQHQAWSGDSWIFLNDTWIHPSQEGHGQLAATVTSGMCTDFAQWCGGATPSWSTTAGPAAAPAAAALTTEAGPTAKAIKKKMKQTIQGKVQKNIKTKKVRHLPSYTKQGQTIFWKSAKGDRCNVEVDRLVIGKKAGSCKLTAKAIYSSSLKNMEKKFVIDVHPKAKKYRSAPSDMRTAASTAHARSSD